LVATTISSRLKSLRSSRPVTASLSPDEYMSAVSKKVKPASAALFTIGSAACSSSAQLRSGSRP
jgi:hypothetical protein